MNALFTVDLDMDIEGFASDLLEYFKTEKTTELAQSLCLWLKKEGAEEEVASIYYNAADLVEKTPI